MLMNESYHILSFRSLCKFTDKLLSLWNLLDLKLPKMIRKLKQLLPVPILTLELYWGVMLCIKTLSQGQSWLSLWGRDDTWQRVWTIWQVDWVLVIVSHCIQPKSFRRPLPLACCGRCVLNCSRSPCVGKHLKSFPSQISSICPR